MAQAYTLLVQKNLESASNISHVHESVSVQNCADENELASRLVEKHTFANSYRKVEE